MSLSDYLVSNRSCDECTVCCTCLRIEKPELTKKADVPCPHLLQHGGCGIYEERPQVCRTWYCGWRVMPFLTDDMRPDRSKILIKQDEAGFVFQPLKSDYVRNLLNENVLTAIGALIDAEVTISTSIPTRPGFTNYKMQINDILKQNVANRDLAGVRTLMRTIIFRSRNAQTIPEPD